MTENKCPKCENPADEFYSGLPGVLCKMRNDRISGRIQVCVACNRFTSKEEAAIALQKSVVKKITWLEPPEFAYKPTVPRQTRRGRALWPDGKIRAVYAGVADKTGAIPAHGSVQKLHISGWVELLDGVWHFRPNPKRAYLVRPDDD